VQAVVGTGGIEVTAGGLEVRSRADGILMEVDGVLAGSQVLEGELNLDAVALGLDGCGSDRDSLGVGEAHYFLNFGKGSGGEYGEDQWSTDEGSLVHENPFD
jgi:hypothetical protein